MSVGLCNVDTGADGCCHGLLDQIHLAGTGLNARVDDGTLFDFRNAGGHADDDAGLDKGEASHLVDELFQHALGHIIVGDNALTQGADGNDVAGGTAQHGLGLGAHLQQLAGILIHSHHGGLIQHDALALHKHQNRSGSQVNTNIFRHGHKIPPHCSFYPLLYTDFPYTLIHVIL